MKISFQQIEYYSRFNKFFHKKNWFFAKENILFENFNIFENNIISAVVAKVLRDWFGLVWYTSVGVGREVVFCLRRGKERVDKFQIEHEL